MAEGITMYASKAAEALLDELGLDSQQMAEGGVDLDEWNGAIMVAIDAAQLEGIRRLHRIKRVFESRSGRGGYDAALSEALRQLGKTEKDLEASCVRDCHCCRWCRRGEIPCAGVTAGGVCDAMCTCDAEYDADPDCSDPCGDDGYDSDYEDQP